MGCFSISFVICVECVSMKYTLLVGTLIQIPFAIGEIILGLEAFLIRDFFNLQLVSHSPLVLLLSYWFLIPEASFFAHLNKF